MTGQDEGSGRVPATVTVLIPTYQEEAAIDGCLEAVARQDAPVLEILVIDGRSEDDTRERAAAHPGVTVLDNPDRIQAAALNIGIAAAKGDVIVRVDGHCTIADDYVSSCLAALERSGAAMVGGGMTPIATTPAQRGIAAAMGSRFGAGPARFHVGGGAGAVDTVYLGAYRTSDARAVGGYATDVGVNEDAEFAHRMAARGPIWFDPAIRSEYVPRSSVPAVAKQFYRYGRSRSITARRHRDSVRPRQLIAPALVLGFVSPWRKPLAIAYGIGILAVAAREPDLDAKGRATFAVTLPTMHLSWGIGFLRGMVGALFGGRGRRG